MSELVTSKFARTQVSWVAVAKEINKRHSREYAPQYIRDVAVGYRGNKRLYNLLESLGVLNLVMQVRREAM